MLSNDVLPFWVGKTKQCVDLPFLNEREEVFYDLPLDIKGSGTLQKSLDRYEGA